VTPPRFLLSFQPLNPDHGGDLHHTRHDAADRRGGTLHQSLTRLIRAAALAGALAGALAAALPAHALEVTLQADAPRALRNDLRDASALLTAEAEGTTDPQALVTLARGEYRRLLAALYANGHYAGEVHVYLDGREAAAIAPFSVPAAINDIRITVTPGPRFRFGALSVAPQAPGTELPRGFRTGQTARSGLVGDAARSAVSAWRQESHAKARIAGRSIVADHPARQLDADIDIEPGPRVRFGRFIPTGSRNVRAQRLQEIAGLPEGAPFDPDTVEKVGDRLRRTGVFRLVKVEEAETLGPGNTLDIHATLEEEKPRRFGFGAELSSFEGLDVSAYWIHRNLFGGAERLRLDGDIEGVGGNTGGVDYRFGARFTRPATFWTDSTFYISAEASVVNEPTFFARYASLGTGLDVEVNEYVEASAGIAYRYSQVRDDLGRREFSHIAFPLEGTWDRRDDEFNPTRGFYLNAETLPFLGILGSDSGLRLTGDARYYRRLGGEGSRFVAAGRFQFGSVLGSSLEGTPPDLLFYSGGGGTVRGQPYQSLHVTLPGGDEIGGRSFVGVSAELRAGITDKLGVVGFADAGWIDSASLPSSTADMHAGAGLGIRYDTAIGPIRLDVATPIAGDTGRGVQLYVGIGQAF